MIRARFRRGPSGALCGFTITNHADPRVCAVVSALSINCVNSVEWFTKAKLSYETNGDGFLTLTAPELERGGQDHDCELLLGSLLLGLKSLQAEYPKELTVIDE